MDARHNKLKDKKFIFIWIGIIVAIIIAIEFSNVKTQTRDSKIKTEAAIKSTANRDKILSFYENFAFDNTSTFVEGFVELLSKKGLSIVN
jgi:uncharacterized membrane protein YgaE (UPF0421/DUF939 family)